MLEAKLLATLHQNYLQLHLVIEELYQSYENGEDKYKNIVSLLPELMEYVYEKIWVDRAVIGKNTEALLYIIVGMRRPLTFTEIYVVFRFATDDLHAKVY